MYQTIPCNTAEELWGLLDPRNPIEKSFSDKEKEQLLYRGQEDSIFKLLPASFRSFFDKKTYESLITAKDLVVREYNEFVNFIESEQYIKFINEGNRIFEYDGGLKKNIRLQLNSEPEIWPPKEIYNSLFLAQHHGAATRLLDWSKHPYVAVYFACQPILVDRREDSVRLRGDIAIWCYLPSRKRRVIVENHPKNFDTNMIAQDGRFTIVKQHMPDANKKFIIQTLDDIENEDNLWKLTLPKSEIFTLLSFCSDSRINASTVYKGRGLDCVTMAYKEKMLLKDKRISKTSVLIDGLSDA